MQNQVKQKLTIETDVHKGLSKEGVKMRNVLGVTT